MSLKSKLKEKLVVMSERLQDTPTVDKPVFFLLAVMYFWLGNFLNTPVSWLNKLFVSSLILIVTIFTFYAYSLVPRDPEETDERA